MLVECHVSRRLARDKAYNSCGVNITVFRGKTCLIYLFIPVFKVTYEKKTFTVLATAQISTYILTLFQLFDVVVTNRISRVC